MKRYRGVSDVIRRQADLFYADLTGEPLFRRLPFRSTPIQRLPEAWEFPAYEEMPIIPPAPEYTPLEDAGVAEAVPRGGRGAFRHDPLGGDAGENVEARFNVDASTTSGSTVDIVVYLHGYGYLQKGEKQRGFLARKAAEAGLDMLDSSGAVRRRTTSPTVALIPRGRHGGGRGWFFDNIPDRAAFDALVAAGLNWLCDIVLGLPSGSSLTRGRLTLMAHSGGGAGMSALLSGANRVDPDEVVCFDSLYGREGPIRDWAVARIGSPSAPKSGLRVFYTGCSGPSSQHPSGRWALQDGKYTLVDTGSWSYANGWVLQTTEPYARRVQEAVEQALRAASNAAGLADRFRVQRTSVAHGDIPAKYSPLLLDDIAATVPKATASPPRTSRPSCVANDNWLTERLRKPGGDSPPPPKPTATSEVAIEDAERVYDAPDKRAFSPSTSATLFRTPPSPVAVAPATEWPDPATDGERVTERALRALGVDAAGIAAFSGAGMAAMRPIASTFGEAALIELLRRLRYTAAQIARPPHSFANDAALTRAFGRAVARPVILAIRTLLAIPGHFRQLARQAGNEHEAYAVEALGWLLLQALRDEVRSASGLQFWLPAPPAFVSAFADPVPGLSPQTERLIVARKLVDSTLDSAEYLRRYQMWHRGPAGRTWRLETGRETISGRAAGAPFYPEVVSIPASIDLAPQRAQVQAAWARRVADFDGGKTAVPLTRCDNAYLTRLRVMSQVSLRGLQLRWQFPSPVSAPAPSSLTGLTVAQPAFEAVFQAIVDLGWNDLVFETQGMLCFRGMKVPGSSAAARRVSNHGLGTAIDLNVFENQQHTAGSMDPRIVALFEAFRFRWGKGFTVPDPMHFEYAR